MGKRCLIWVLARLMRLLQVGARMALRDERRPEHLDLDLLRARTDELNEAAEGYFVDYPDPEFLLDKPFAEAEEFPRRLFDLGVLFHALRLSPDVVVLELGAGSCWVSHFLNRYGCKTISVDVSETALGLGRKLFERDALTRWDVEPEFLTYDGHRLPLPDGGCDRIVINDAFHHIPNPQELLNEMARVLRDGGIVAMSEPGAGHWRSEDSLREVETTGVLENEIILAELDAMARRAGFTEVSLVPLSLEGAREVPIADLGTVREIESQLAGWQPFGRGARYIILHKGLWVQDVRRARELDAQIEIVEPSTWKAGEALRVAAGEGVPVRLRVTNRSDSRWLAGAAEEPGWTRLGVHLYPAPELAAGGGGGAGEAEPLDFDWFRASLAEGDVPPGAVVRLDVELPAVAEPGRYRLVFDLVAEQCFWFAQRGSPTLEVDLEVENR